MCDYSKCDYLESLQYSGSTRYFYGSIKIRYFRLQKLQCKSKKIRRVHVFINKLSNWSYSGQLIFFTCGCSSWECEVGVNFAADSICVLRRSENHSKKPNAADFHNLNVKHKAKMEHLFTCKSRLISHATINRRRIYQIPWRILSTPVLIEKERTLQAVTYWQ